MLKTTLIAIILWPISLVPGLYIALKAPAKTEAFSGTVTRVVDGDTLDVERSANNISRLRLACIDAPEKAQKPYGIRSKAKLIELTLGKRIDVESVGPDQYGRLISKAEINGESVNLKLVKEGHAAVYQKYLGPCPDLKEELMEAEAKAKKKRLGMWEQEPQIMPWDWRKR